MNDMTITIAPRHNEVMDYLLRILAEFEAARQVRVTPQTLSWPEMWSKMRAIALNREGPAMSEVGTTWIGSFVGMNALRQFSPTEVAHIVNPEDLIPAAWQTTSFRGDNRIWSIPWQVDVRAILYWRDMLDDAGIDETTAFQSLDDMEATFQRLADCGMTTPWVEGTYSNKNSVYHAASWIWSMGGDYISEDGRQTCFHTPEVLGGLSRYFGLYRYMPKDDELTDSDQAVERFAERKAAAMISGSWAMMTILQNNPDAASRLGVTLPPGPPFVGGTNLVLWRHINARDEGSALELLQWLMSYEAQRGLCGVTTGALLPSRLDVLDDLDDFAFPQHQVFIDAIKVGRSMPSISIWSIVEERLIAAFRRIWTDIMADPDQPVADVIARHLEPLARRLDRTLSQTRS